MNAFFENLSTQLSSVILLVTRVLIGYMYLLHGTSKFFEVPVSLTGGNGSVELFSIFGLGGILEIGGGLLLILGLFTRPAAFILAGQMAVAYFMFHVGSSGIIFDPLSNKGEVAALYSLTFLLLMYTGAGKFSLDTKLAK
ncbi:MAG: DoxX family protein [Pelistega sp.]|nr:DoxX family protein [Pelistega sp.]